MKYFLVDVTNKTEEDVQFGTCDLCSYMGTHYYDILILKDENGKEYRVENGFWCWGDYLVNWHIDNYIQFAAFIQGRDYPEPEQDQYGDDLIERVIDQMYDDYTDEVDQEDE